ncbi:MAG: hypothetical protein D4R64_01830 [Porphyromonadaceae bacterium]|nr:MAG: hypothetical protein D4R64_01830 [Porphyromonadaceae bacterium]
MKTLDAINLYEQVHALIQGLNRQFGAIEWLVDIETLLPRHKVFESDKGYTHFTWIFGALEYSINNELHMLINIGELTCIYNLIRYFPVSVGQEIKVKIKPHFKEVAKSVAVNRNNFIAHRNIEGLVDYEIIDFKMLKRVISELKEIDQKYFEPEFSKSS